MLCKAETTRKRMCRLTSRLAGKSGNICFVYMQDSSYIEEFGSNRTSRIRHKEIEITGMGVYVAWPLTHTSRQEKIQQLFFAQDGKTSQRFYDRPDDHQRTRAGGSNRQCVFLVDPNTTRGSGEGSQFIPNSMKRAQEISLPYPRHEVLLIENMFQRNDDDHAKHIIRSLRRCQSCAVG